MDKGQENDTERLGPTSSQLLGIPEMIKTSVNKHVDVFYFLNFIVLQLGIPEMIKTSVHEHGTKETSKEKKRTME
ncbi:hypothetical protein BgiBS90_015706 [Biomphalaria glabrata]|nr:hypothetical protein BgiBS90_015706 [Biomphalaria glabrata]